MDQIVRQRLQNQRLAGNPSKKPEEVVQWLGAEVAALEAAAKQYSRFLEIPVVLDF